MTKIDWYTICKVKFAMWAKNRTKEELIQAASDVLKQRLTTHDALGIATLNAKSAAIRSAIKTK